jgi:demethylmenaquinone methyltransferase/2-methoxy-6-polyprenyl-1,4-benzoquinol methylase/phosphoethanolamine N-methyltransferase
MDAVHGYGHGHGHKHGQTHPAAPATAGRLIGWARFYDPLVWVMLLGRTRALRALPLDLAAVRPGERVLEVGCGTGELALAAARRVGRGGSVVGIDAAPAMIEVARSKARRTGSPARFQIETVEAMSFPDGAFDVVLSSLMMHHLPGELKGRALSEIRRVLRPGGRIVIIDLQAPTRPPRPWEPGWLLLRRHRLHAHSEAAARLGGPALAALLRDAGFAAVESGPTRFPWIGYARGRAPV